MNMRDEIAQIIEDNHDCAVFDGPNNCPEIADAIIAALPDMVPELVWGDTSYGMPECFVLNAVYRINNARDGGYSVNCGRDIIRQSNGLANYPTLSEAKTAANKHHRAQIMKGLGLDTD